MPDNDLLALPQATLLHEKYKINRTLGIGGFGIIYLAWDDVSLRQVVVKECFPTNYAYRDENGDIQTKTPEEAELFNDCILNAINEAAVMIQINTEGVVKIYDHFYAHNTFYYVMELVSGPSLWDQMLVRREEQQPWTAEEVQSLLYELLTILKNLHAEQIYHSDIKPANILMQDDHRPMLVDFGAVRTKDLQHGGLVQITPGYTPPEFYPGMRRELGGWSDLYELGATFFELLTERTPEPGDQRLVRDRTIKLAHSELAQRVPIAILASIDKALEPDYRNRFSSAKVWLDYLANPPITTRLNKADAGAQIVNKGKISLKQAKPVAVKKESLGCMSLILFALSAILAAFILAHYVIKVDWDSLNLPEPLSKVIQSCVETLPQRGE